MLLVSVLVNSFLRTTCLANSMNTQEVETVSNAEPAKQVGTAQARFFALRGWSPTQLGGVHWVAGGIGARWLMSLPEWEEPNAPPRELARLLRFTKMLALRYPASGPIGIPNGLYICRERNYSLNHVHGKRYVKAGMKRCEVRPVDANELLLEGIECNRDTMRRQSRDNPEYSDPKRWERFVEAALSVPEIQVLGAFVDGHLAAYSLSCLEDGWCSVLYANSRTHLQEHHPNQVLAFTVIQRALRRPDVSAVCAGPKRVLVTDGLDEHKTRMGFQLEPSKVIVRLHPALEGLMTSPLILKPLDWLRDLWPTSLAIQRTGTVLASVSDARRLDPAATCVGQCKPRHVSS